MSPQEPPDPQFEALLDFLRFSRGFDFTGYKRSSLMRRVNKRRYALSMDNFGDYLDYLQVHPDEFELLFNTILINVTSFFRDKPAWDYLTSEILPRIMRNKDDMEPIRVWSAGCASGEEAYTLAMAIAEYLGTGAFHKRVKIYATDIDGEALVQARQATYTHDDIKDIPEELCSKYFMQSNESDYVFNSDLRRAVIFGLHDLVQDAPISRLDLLVCRNTLMYFNAETQGRILARFHFALNDNGVLFLGRAEMLLTHANLFSSLDMKYRFFTKVPRPDIRNHLLALGQNSDEQVTTRLGRLMRMRDLSFENSPEAQLIVDVNSTLLAANEQAKKLFGIKPRDVGSMIHDLEICYQPVGLRPLFDRVIAENRPLMVPAVELHTADGECVFLDIHINPLNENDEHILGINVVFIDISHRKNLEEQLKNSTAELETTNEELQSTNEELETINDELNQRTNELNISKSFLETILGNLKVGIVVVDRDFRILNWNSMAEDLWGLRADEIMGSSFLGLDIGLPVENLKHPIRSVLDEKTDLQDVRLKAINRRGKSIRCQVTCTPFDGGTQERQGVVLMMEEEAEDK
jgi:two-component system CheB/CheR fusion protein